MVSSISMIRTCTLMARRISMSNLIKESIAFDFLSVTMIL